MAKKEPAADAVACPKHPDEKAVSRCFACLRPLCARCVRTVRGHDFCSDKCADNHFRTDSNMEGYRARVKRDRARRTVVKLIVVLVVLGAAAYVGLVYLRDPQRRAALARQAEGLKKKAEELGGSMDPVARNALNTLLEDLAAEAGKDQFPKAQTHFAPRCTYLPFPASRPLDAAAFLKMMKSNIRGDFAIHKTKGWDYLELTKQYRCEAELHFREADSSGVSNHVLTVQFTCEKVGGTWQIVEVKELGAMVNKRA